jgi:EAL domain-containing protein (putative c-di-GMP-specific phosphodiesterase class I)/FixJ family two-component response regulator
MSAADAPEERRARIAAALPEAFRGGRIAYHLQPQIDLRSGTVIGLEALLRWTDPELGAVSPAEFVPIAQASGLLVAIGAWLHRAVCEQTVAWAADGIAPVRVSLNVGALAIADPTFSSGLQRIILETGADPAHLGIEVAESVLMADPVRAREMLLELRSIGIETALDNFGTSYSNLGVLRSLPLDLLKIDRSLIHDVTAAPEDISITRAVLLMARSLKLRVLAEGVETEGQLKLLVANGCELVQGFVFSAPQPPEAIGALLRSGRRLPDHLLTRSDRRRTLLLVDDEENILASLRRSLRSGGYQILTARSGPEALALLAEHEVDVVVSDQRLPGMTGVELLRRVRDLHPETVRIVLSGYTELQSITDAVNEGAIYKFLTKPWDDERLRAHVAEAFARKGMADENARLAAELRATNARLAQALQRQEELLRRQDATIDLESHRAGHARELVDDLPAGVLGIDDAGTVAFANRAARALLGGGGRGLVGSDADGVLPPGWRAAADGGARRCAVAGRACVVSVQATRDGARARGHLVSLVPEPEARAASRAAATLPHPFAVPAPNLFPVPTPAPIPALQE